MFESNRLGNASRKTYESCKKGPKIESYLNVVKTKMETGHGPEDVFVLDKYRNLHGLEIFDSAPTRQTLIT